MKKQLFFPVFFIYLFTCSNFCEGQYIITYAGTGVDGFGGDGGPASIAKLGTPSGVYFDKSGNLYIADQAGERIRKVTPAGIISTVAGNGGTGGYSADGIPATASSLNYPEGVAVDKYGNIYIADQYNERIRKVDASGIITTIAGKDSSGITLGYNGDGIPATDAFLYNPEDVGVDDSGNVYFCDEDNQRIRKISTSGIITTIAGNGITGYNGDGGPATAAMLNYPNGIAVDSVGNVYVADFFNDRVRKISISGIITTVAGDSTGGYTGDGSQATAARLSRPSAVHIDRYGNMYITDCYNYVIRKVNAAGIISTIAGDYTLGPGYGGDCGPATDGQLSFGQGVTADTSGNVYLADFNNARIREITDSIHCPSLMVKNNDLLPGLKLFPNPSAGQFTIQAKNFTYPCKIEVYNTIGEKIYESESNSMETKINLVRQPPGIYILYFRSNERIIVEKLIINNLAY